MKMKPLRIATIALLVLSALAIIGALAGQHYLSPPDSQSPPWCYAQEDSTGCVDGPKYIAAVKDGVHRQVARTQAYLTEHPHATHLLQRIDLVDADAYVFIVDGSNWSGWYITGQFGGGETDGAYYYDGVTGSYGVCGARYLKYDWGVAAANRSEKCPIALAGQVNDDVLAHIDQQ